MSIKHGVGESNVGRRRQNESVEEGDRGGPCFWVLGSLRVPLSDVAVYRIITLSCSRWLEETDSEVFIPIVL